MPSSSNALEKQGSDADSDDSNSATSKPKSDEQPSTSTNEPSTNPSSVVATVSTSTGETRNQTAQSGTSTQPATLPLASAAAAAAPVESPNEKKSARSAGYKEFFLQKLRVLLDSESRKEGTPVRWSEDGSSFTITDHHRFEEQLIPIYFGNQIAFSSFLRRLQRWGFKRMSSRRNGQYEYSSPTFKRIGPHIAPTAGATATNNTAGNNGGVASMQAQQQQQTQQTQASSLLQQVMAQLNPPQMPSLNPLPSQALADANVNAIADLISNIQRSGQYPSASNQQQQPVINQHGNQVDAANAISILQSIMGSNQQQQQQQQPLPSQNSQPSQHPSHNHHTSQLNNIDSNNYQQQSQQWQHQNPMMNVLNNVLSNIVGGPTPTSSAQAIPYSSQSSLVHALLSLSGMLPQLPLLNSNATLPAASQPVNNMLPVQTLVLLLQRINEEEQQRRAQVDALHQVIIATIELILGSNTVEGEAQGQGQGHTTHRQTVGRAGESSSHQNNARPRNPTGMTVRVEHSHLAQPQQQVVGAPPLPVGNIQADSIAFLLQAAQRGGGIAQPPQQDVRAQRTSPVTNNEDGDEEKSDGPLTSRKRKSPSSPEDNQYDSDEDSWNGRLRPRKKSPRK